MVFICDGRIGLCCVYVAFLVTYPYEFINGDVDAYSGGKCNGARALTDKLGLIRSYQGFLLGEYALQSIRDTLIVHSGWCLTASSQETCNHCCLLDPPTTLCC